MLVNDVINQKAVDVGHGVSDSNEIVAKSIHWVHIGHLARQQFNSVGVQISDPSPVELDFLDFVRDLHILLQPLQSRLSRQKNVFAFVEFELSLGKVEFEALPTEGLTAHAFD